MHSLPSRYSPYDVILMTLFSANLGFLWADLPLPEAIHAAKDSSFDAVECHWPFAFSADDVKAALDATGLEMLCLNTPKGDGFGLAALGNRGAAREAIDTALDYAIAISCPNVHVMAGCTAEADALDEFCHNLTYATDVAAEHGITILIEPINTIDVPSYFLNRISEALAIIDRIGAKNLKLMFDAYHVAMMGDDVLAELNRAYEVIGHIQFAGVPNRGTPDEGDVDYRPLFAHLAHLGYDRPLGAEYKPAHGDTASSLAWMDKLNLM